MPIDLREVEPLSSKSLLMEQAMRRKRGNEFAEMDMSDMLAPELEWIHEDKEALQSLVKQLDASIGQINGQIRDMQDKASKTRGLVDKEQQLMFKQIQTLNNLLKRQVNIFVALERQLKQFDIKQNNLLPQIGIGLIAGLMSAVTILVTAPWMTVLVENIR